MVPEMKLSALFPKNGFWRESSAERIAAPIGWDYDGNPFWLEWYDHSCLKVSGASGAGKTNLVHVLVHSLASRYSPDELRFFYLGAKGMGELAPYCGSGMGDGPAFPWLPHFSYFDFEEMSKLHRLRDPKERFRVFSDWKREYEGTRARGMGRKVKKWFFFSEFVRQRYPVFRKDGGKMPRMLIFIDGIDEMSADMDDVFKTVESLGEGICVVVLARNFNIMEPAGCRDFQNQRDVLAFRGSSGGDVYGPYFYSQWMMMPFGKFSDSSSPVKRHVVEETLKDLSLPGQFVSLERFESLHDYTFTYPDRRLQPAISTTPLVDFSSEDCRLFRSEIEKASRQISGGTVVSQP